MVKKIVENDIRTLIRAMIEQEMDKIDVDDEEDKFDVTEKCKKDEELEIEIDETSSVTGMAGGESYQTPYAFAKRLRDRTREISQQLGYKLVNDPEDRDWKDIEDAQKESLVYRKKFGEAKDKNINEAKNYTIVAIKNNKVVDQFYTPDKKEIDDVISVMKKDNKGATISVEDPGGKVIKVVNEGRPVENINESKQENINETNIGKKGSIKSIGTWIKILKAARKGQYTFDKDDMRDLIDSLKNISQSIEALNEGRRGAYQNYRDDSDKTPRQKIGEAIRGVRNQLQEIEKTIDLNLRLKQETGIDSQKYWKNTHRALSKINERMTRIINKVRRF